VGNGSGPQKQGGDATALLGAAYVEHAWSAAASDSYCSRSLLGVENGRIAEVVKGARQRGRLAFPAARSSRHGQYPTRSHSCCADRATISRSWRGSTT
jgi:hypothetical protein